MKAGTERRSSVSVFWSIWLKHTHRACWVQRAAALQSLHEKTNWSWAFALTQLSPLALQVSPLFIMSTLVILILSDPSKQWNLIVCGFRRSQDPQSVDFVLKVWGAFVAQLLETEKTWTIPGRSSDHWGHLSVGLTPKNIGAVYITTICQGKCIAPWESCSILPDLAFLKHRSNLDDKTGQTAILEKLQQSWSKCKHWLQM